MNEYNVKLKSENEGTLDPPNFTHRFTVKIAKNYKIILIKIKGYNPSCILLLQMDKVK